MSFIVVVVVAVVEIRIYFSMVWYMLSQLRHKDNIGRHLFRVICRSIVIWLLILGMMDLMDLKSMTTVLEGSRSTRGSAMW